MKLKWRLDLNTIVLVLLIVIFSGILYLNFEKTSTIEGARGQSKPWPSRASSSPWLPSSTSWWPSPRTSQSSPTSSQSSPTSSQSSSTSSQSSPTSSQSSPTSSPTSVTAANNALEAIQTDIQDYMGYKATFDAIIQEKGGYDTEIGTVDSLLKEVVDSSSSGINLIDRTVITGRQAVLNTTIVGYNDTIRDIKTKTGLTSTPNTQVSAAIQDKIIGFMKQEAVAKQAKEELSKFTIAMVMPIDSGATITINYNSKLSHAPRYKITTNPSVPTMTAVEDPNPLPATTVVTLGGLLNNKSYTFSVTADYEGGVTRTVSHPTGFMPIGKPSITVVGGTGFVDVKIEPPYYGSSPISYIINKNSEATSTTVTYTAAKVPIRFDNLSNDAPYTFSVVAKYDDNINSPPTTATATPRSSPSGTGEGNDRSVKINITKPDGAAPVSYLISGRQTISQVGRTEREVLASTTSVQFADLENGKEYSFSITAIHLDGSRSSPSAPIIVTPKSPPPPPPPPPPRPPPPPPPPKPAARPWYQFW